MGGEGAPDNGRPSGGDTSGSGATGRGDARALEGGALGLRAARKAPGQMRRRGKTRALGLDGGVRGDVYVHRRSAESGENSITVNYNYDPPPN